MTLEDTTSVEAPASAAPAPVTTVVVEHRPEPTQAERRSTHEAAKRAHLDAVYDRAMKRHEAPGREDDPAIKAAADRAEKGAAPAGSVAPARAADGKFVAAEAQIGHNQPPEKTPDVVSSPDEKPSGDESQTKTETTKAETPKTAPKEPAEKTRPAIPKPQSWGDDARSDWDTLSPKVQERIAKREREVANGFRRYGQELKTNEPLIKVAAEYSDVLRGWDLTPDKAMRGLLDTATRLHQNPKAELLRLADSYGVSLASLQGDIDYSLLPPDPRLEDAYAGIQTAQREATTWKNRYEAQQRDIQEYVRQLDADRQHQERASRRSVVDGVANEIPGLEAHADKLVPIIRGLSQSDPDAEPAAILKEAWEILQLRDPAFRKTRMDQELAKADKSRAAEASRIASSINIQSSNPRANTALSLRQIQDAAFDAAMRRTASLNR